MHSGIKVTLGFCVKNCATIVQAAIESIICQDFSHEYMEIIVVDGFSTDETLSIIKKSYQIN